MSTATVPLCGHCGRPVIGASAQTAVYHAGAAYHWLCTQPPPAPAAPTSPGCICPPGAERTCQGLTCPRQRFRVP